MYKTLKNNKFASLFLRFHRIFGVITHLFSVDRVQNSNNWRLNSYSARPLRRFSWWRHKPRLPSRSLYARRAESGHANSRKVRSTWPKVIATESYLARWHPSAYGLGPSFPRSKNFSRGKNLRPTASAPNSRARQLTITFGLVRRTWRSLCIPPLSSLYA